MRKSEKKGPNSKFPRCPFFKFFVVTREVICQKMAPILDPVNFFWVFSLLGSCGSGVAKEVGRMASMKKFYDVLATKFNLEYGNVLLATSKESDLQTMISNKFPFFTNHTDLIKTIVGKTRWQRRHVCVIFQACFAIVLTVNTQVLLCILLWNLTYEMDELFIHLIC